MQVEDYHKENELGFSCSRTDWLPLIDTAIHAQSQKSSTSPSKYQKNAKRSGFS